MELTQERKDAVQASWVLVRKNNRQNAVDFFICFFKRHPEYQLMFKDLRDLSADELPTHPKMRTHGVRVFYAISSMVDNLDDLDVVVIITKKTVNDHFPRGVRGKHYENLFATILVFLEERLGAAYDQVTKEGWEAVAAVLLSVINQELKEKLDTVENAS